MHPSLPHYKFRQFTYRSDHQEAAIGKKEKQKKDETFPGNKNPFPPFSLKRQHDCVSVCAE